MDLQLSHHLHSRRNFKTRLGFSELVSIKYHNLFGFALTREELSRWKVGEAQRSSYKLFNKNLVTFQDGFYFLKENKGAVLKRILRKEFWLKKMGIAKRAAVILERISTIKMVAVTGSLAMKNASEDSDIDLIIVTLKGTLWMTRLFVYLILRAMNYKLRRAGSVIEKDKLCLNMWMDEGDLKIEKRNIYTAHEIAQVVPLVNKNHAYERFILENSWIKEYWPNAVKIQNAKVKSQKYKSKVKNILSILELAAFKIQYRKMRSRITNETVTATRAFFHPQDLSARAGQILEFGNLGQSRTSA